MLRTRSKAGTGLLCFLVAATMVFTVDKAPADDDQSSTPPEKAKQAPVSDNVTRSITIHTPSVAVRVNPAQAGKSRDRNAVHGAGQYAFVDQNGNLIGSPPPRATVPQLAPQSPDDPTPYRSTVNPDAIMVDTTHIRAVTSARINEDGRIEMICRDDHGSPGHHCEIHPSKAAETSNQAPAGNSMKEDR